MPDSIKWPVVLVCPADDELSLLAELSARRDTKIVAIADPDSSSMGASLAEIMGIPVIKSLTDLDNINGPKAKYVIHPPCNDTIARFLDQAEVMGLVCVPAADFPTFSARQTPEPVELKIATEAVEDSEFLETETAAIHRTLSRIEEAMDREALLRWLLGLATRATGATSGSVMLFDKATNELYLAFAYGLSENTMHRTRIKLGEGISGRVAASGQAELVTGMKHPGANRDRSTIKDAICAPIVWEGQLLGVLNVSTNECENALQLNSLSKVKSLTHRFGMILNRFLTLQTIRDGELFRTLEETLSMDTGHPSNAGTTLALWAEDLADVSGAESVTLEVIAGSDLLVADYQGFSYESPIPADKASVLQTGRPIVQRPINTTSGEYETGETVFLLPVGSEPTKALMQVQFKSAARSHRFFNISSEILYLVNKNLTSFLDRVETSDQLDRLTTMTTVLAELAAASKRDPDSVKDKILAAACTLTGASDAFLLEDANRYYANNKHRGKTLDLSPELIGHVGHLLEKSQEHGWLTTILASDGMKEPKGKERSILVAPLQSDGPYPGLILIDKNRLHPLDNAGFTEFDALFTRRLLPFLELPATVQASRVDATVDAVIAEPTNSEPIITEPKIETPPEPTTATLVMQAEHPQMPILEVLRREMDRCDRYHLMLGLTAYRFKNATELPIDAAGIVLQVADIMRTSDFVTCLEDGTFLVLVPEDVRSLSMLRKRVTARMLAVCGIPDLEISSAARTYPGSGDSPEKLLNSLLSLLD